MRVSVCAAIAAACLISFNWSQAQDVSSPPPSTPRPPSADGPSTAAAAVMRTNSMSVLDDKKKLGPNDYVSFRVVEDRDNESQRLRVNDNGELEVPYVGLVAAQG
jgi:protein involved in polysaccharide export with SLBB domain